MVLQGVFGRIKVLFCKYGRVKYRHCCFHAFQVVFMVFWSVLGRIEVFYDNVGRVLTGRFRDNVTSIQKYAFRSFCQSQMERGRAFPDAPNCATPPELCSGLGIGAPRRVGGCESFSHILRPP